MENKNIEQYYKNAFSGFNYQLSGTFWRKLKWRLLLMNWSYYLIGAGSIGLLGLVYYFWPMTFQSEPHLNTHFASSLVYQSTVIQKADNVSTIPASEPERSKIEPKQKSVINAGKSLSLVDKQKNEILIRIEKEREYNPVVYQFEEINIDLKSDKEDEINALVPMDVSGLTSETPSIYYDSISRLFIPDQKVTYSVNLFVSPAYNLFSMNTDADFADYLNYRDSHESTTVSMSAGIDFQINIRNWYIQTGLTYTRLSSSRNFNHSFKAYDSLRSYYTYDTTWGFVYDPPEYGKPVVIGIDSTWTKVYNDINEGLNHWNYLEIPLLIGYELNKNRFSFDIATGVSLGFLINATGNIPSPDEENVFYDLSLSNGILNGRMFNYIIQAGASYHVTPNWRLMAKPYYRLNLNPVFNNSYPVDQRFSVFGIKLGLSVYL